MSQAARRADPALPPSNALVTDDLVNRYVVSTFERFEHTLAALEPSLVEPILPNEIERAFTRLRLLVESLTGLALGITVGQVGAVIRRGFGETTRAAIDQQLAAIARGGWMVPVPAGDAASSATTDRPLVDELVASLHPRLRRIVPNARGLVSKLVTTVERVAPSEVRALAQALALLGDDDAGALAFGDHLQLGWQHYRALVAGAPQPAAGDSIEARRRHQTWRAWSRRVRGDTPERAPSREQVAARGFVMRIE